MRYKAILHILGIFLTIFSTSMVPPIIVDLIYQENLIFPFIITFAILLSIGASMWLYFRDESYELKSRDGFIIVVAFWIILSAFACLPFIFATSVDISFTDAMFESVSGFTTTGASVITGLDTLPHAVLFYRQQLELMGGIGIIVLAVAILPMLGIGGMQLIRAEVPGPMKDKKLKPRLTQTAKSLWVIYLVLTGMCALAYWGAGMPLFYAIGESFSTVTTGGFSMHDASFAYYDNPIIEIIAIVFMILGSTNFALHFIAVSRLSFNHYWQDTEFKAYILILLTVAVVTVITLALLKVYDNGNTTIVKGVFNVVSLATTTGFTSAPFSEWPLFLPILIMLAAIIGGCAASTSGGIKVIRMVLVYKQSAREIKRLIHASAVLPIKFGKQILPEYILQAMWSFIAIFILVFILVFLTLMGTGLDITTAFGASVATLANTGATIGDLANGYGHLPDHTKWILMLAMLAGRLEIFTLFILFTPGFWKH